MKNRFFGLLLILLLVAGAGFVSCSDQPGPDPVTTEPGSTDSYPATELTPVFTNLVLDQSGRVSSNVESIRINSNVVVQVGTGSENWEVMLADLLYSPVSVMGLKAKDSSKETSDEAVLYGKTLVVKSSPVSGGTQFTGEHKDEDDGNTDVFFRFTVNASGTKITDYIEAVVVETKNTTNFTTETLIVKTADELVVSATGLMGYYKTYVHISGGTQQMSVHEAYVYTSNSEGKGATVVSSRRPSDTQGYASLGDMGLYFNAGLDNVSKFIAKMDGYVAAEKPSDTSKPEAIELCPLYDDYKKTAGSTGAGPGIRNYVYCIYDLTEGKVTRYQSTAPSGSNITSLNTVQAMIWGNGKGKINGEAYTDNSGKDTFEGFKINTTEKVLLTADERGILVPVFNSVPAAPGIGVDLKPEGNYEFVSRADEVDENTVADTLVKKYAPLSLMGIKLADSYTGGTETLRGKDFRVSYTKVDGGYRYVGTADNGFFAFTIDENGTAIRDYIEAGIFNDMYDGKVYTIKKADKLTVGMGEIFGFYKIYSYGSFIISGEPLYYYSADEAWYYSDSSKAGMIVSQNLNFRDVAKNVDRADFSEDGIKNAVSAFEESIASSSAEFDLNPMYGRYKKLRNTQKCFISAVYDLSQNGKLVDFFPYELVSPYNGHSLDAGIKLNDFVDHIQSDWSTFVGPVREQEQQ